MSVTLGTMRLCSDCAKGLVSTIRQLHDGVSALVQYIFLGTAFLEAIRIQETIASQEARSLVEYESIVDEKGRKGMRIEAR